MSRSIREGEQRRLEGFLDLVPHPILLIEAATGAVQFANRAAREASVNVHVEAAAQPGATTYVSDARGERIPPDDLPWRRTPQEGAPERAYLDLHGPDGAAVPYLVTCSSAPITQERPDLLVVSLQDITDLKRTEAELKEALGARDEFLSIAAHELRAPLATLRLMLEGIERRVTRKGPLSTEDLTARFDPMKRQIDRLTALTDRLLDVGRIQSKRLTLDLQETDLCALVTDACERCRERATQAGSELSVGACSPVLGLWDRVRLEQVVTNLLSNAIKYGDGKPIHVAVGEGSGVATLHIEDHGIGIPKEALPRIFAPYERVTSAYRAESLGLGLYIVNEIVKAHGGSIEVDSMPGRGTTFALKLPTGK